jgi:hypothetical protein
MSYIINNNPKLFPGHYTTNDELEKIINFANSSEPSDVQYFLKTGDERIRNVQDLIDKHLIITAGANAKLDAIRLKLDKLKSVEQANNDLKTKIRNGESEYVETTLQKNSLNNNNAYLDNNIPTDFSTTEYYKIENGTVVKIGKLVKIIEQHFFTTSTNEFSFLLNSNERSTMHSDVPLVVYKLKTTPPPPNRKHHTPSPRRSPHAPKKNKTPQEKSQEDKSQSEKVAPSQIGVLIKSLLIKSV